MNRKVRAAIVDALIARDGYVCQFPGCTRPFTSEDPPTIDHWIPRSVSGDDTLSNLRLMHRECNNTKGDSIPNPDGTLSLVKAVSIVRQPRPSLCDTCMSGRILLVGEKCPDCKSGPQPAGSPTAYKKNPKNCTHSGYDHCWLCHVGLVERK